MRFYKDDDLLPMCFTEQGCPVEDLATDAELSAKVDQFLTAKALYNCTEDPATQRQAFEALELYDDPKTHLEMEMTYAQWRQLKK